MTEEEVLRTNKGTILNSKMNSTAMKRTWIERKAPWKAQDRNNGKGNEPYDVPTTTERQRKRPKKEPEKKHPANKAAPPNAKEKRTIKNNAWIHRTGEGAKRNRDRNRTTKKRVHTQRSQPKH